MPDKKNAACDNCGFLKNAFFQENDLDNFMSIGLHFAWSL